MREKTGRLTQEQTRRVGVAGLRRVCAASRDVQLVALKAVLEGRARLMRWIRFHVPARYCVADKATGGGARTGPALEARAAQHGHSAAQRGSHLRSGIYPDSSSARTISWLSKRRSTINET